MPLFDGQKNLINESIQHFFFFSENAAQFISEVKDITEALTAGNLDPQHDLFLLRKCFFDPSSMLNRVDLRPNLNEANEDKEAKRHAERSDQKITIGDIQRQIIEFAAASIEKTAQNLGVDLKSLPWDKSKLDSIVNSPDSAELFETTGLSVDSGNPNDFMDTTLRVFDATISQDSNNHSFILNIRFKHPPNKCEVFPIDDLSDSDDENEDINVPQLMREIQAEARKIVEHNAPARNLDILVENNIISKEDAEKLFSDFYTKIILTYQVYFDLLAQKKITLGEISFLHDWQFNTLKNPTAIELIKNKKLTLQQAKKLSEPAEKIILNPYYASRLLNNTPELKELINIPPQGSRVLAHPSIINLLTLQKISFIQAKNTSIDALSVISDEFYFNFLKKNLLDFEIIKKINKDDTEVLLSPLIIKLIANNIIDAKTIMEIKFYRAQILTGKNINDLLIKKHISLEEALNITSGAARVIEENPFILNSIKKGVLQVKHIECITIEENNPMQFYKEQIAQITQKYRQLNINPYTIWRDIIGDRLLEIYHKAPYTINDTQHALIDIKNEIDEISTTHQICPDTLLEASIEYLLKNIKKEFTFCHSNSRDIEHAIAETIKAAEEEKSETPRKWNDALTQIIRIAEHPENVPTHSFIAKINLSGKNARPLIIDSEHKEQPNKRRRIESNTSQSQTLFSHPPENTLNEFCKKIKSLSDIINIISPANAYMFV